MPCCYEHPSHSPSKDHLSGVVEPRRDTLPSVPPTSQSVVLYGHRAGPWDHHQEMPFPMSSRATIAPRPYLLPKTTLQSPRGRGSAGRSPSGCSKQNRPATRLGGFPFKTQRALVAMIAALLIAGDDPIFNVNHAMRVFGDIVLVRDQDDRVPLGLQTVEQRHDFEASL